jgi:hypothetical protein
LNPRVLWTCLPVLSTPATGDTRPAAQQDPSVDTLDVRVMFSSPGSLVVDRGRVDFVEIGDGVTLDLKDGKTLHGSVTKVDERSAAVKLDDPRAVAPTGSRGRIQIPKARRNPPKKTPPPDAKPAEPKPAPADAPKPAPKGDAKPDAKAQPKPAAPAEPAQEPKPAEAPAKAAPDHPDWSNTDKSWTKGMPLLTELPPVRPEQRTPSITGRLESSAEYVRSPGGRSSDSYVEAGGEVTAENLFGDGATLHVEGDVYHRAEVDGGNGIGVLLYQASYTWGGTRFDPQRLEVGRFLQHGMPEFGVVDGAEYTRRLSDGNSLGVSVGWMPEPDDDFGSFHDFQVAAYYHWTKDNSERFSATAGFEKTFHDWSRDRDLFVANVRAPLDLETDVHGTAWVDLYDSGDDQKRSAVELTQALLVLNHRFGHDAGGDVTFRHQRFPQIDREGEFTPIAPAEIEDNHVEELSSSAYVYTESHHRLHGQVGVWSDEDEKGGSADAGIEFPEVLIDALKADFTVIGSRGQFSTILGGRVTCALPAENGHWDLSYEYANHRLHDAPSAQNDLVQQQVFFDRSFLFDHGWSLSLAGSATWWDTDVTWSVGWFVQKTF